MERVQFVVPDGFDDPGQPTGGNIYDQRACAGLAQAGWDVRVTTVPAAQPEAGLARAMSALQDNSTVLIDGLLASPAARQLLPHADRIRLTILVHMLSDASIESSEQAVLQAAAAVIATSNWTRDQVLARYPIPADRVHVAQPGVDQVAIEPPSPVPGRLICVGVLSEHKGQDILVDALAELADSDWHCVLAGSLDRDPDFTRQLRARIERLGLADRIRLPGVLTSAELNDLYTTADLLIAPSRSETYGMTVTEALAHGLPVIAAATGGLPEALGELADGSRPGQLVPAENPEALAAAIGQWLGDERHRRRLRTAAQQRRPTLRTWTQTALELAAALRP